VKTTPKVTPCSIGISCIYTDKRIMFDNVVAIEQTSAYTLY